MLFSWYWEISYPWILDSDLVRQLLFCRCIQFSSFWKLICCSHWQGSENIWFTAVLQPGMLVTNSSENTFSPVLCTAWEVFASTAPGCCQPCRMNDRPCLSQAFTCPTFISQKGGKGVVPHEILMQNENVVPGSGGRGLHTALWRHKNPGKEARGRECRCICHLL